MTDFPALEQDIRAAARTAFAELSARAAPEPLCAFALYSDDGAMTVCPAANTATHLQAAVAENPEFGDDSEFSTAEWKYEGEGADAAFDAICGRLAQQVMALDEDGPAFADFRQGVFGACLRALQSLNDEGLFGSALLLFGVSDGDITAEDVALVKALNDGPTGERFERWARSFNDL